jgi:hypothetical protein
MEDLKKSTVVFADETGMRIAGSGKYLHTVADQRTTHLWAMMSRGFDAHTPENSPLLGFTNTIMQDRWQTYNKFDGASHLYCNAHLMRDLRSLCEQNYEWAFRLRISMNRSFLSTISTKIFFYRFCTVEARFSHFYLLFRNFISFSTCPK